MKILTTVTVKQEEKKVDKIHPLEAKHNCDQLEQSIKAAEDALRAIFIDLQTLKDGRYQKTDSMMQQ